MDFLTPSCVVQAFLLHEFVALGGIAAVSAGVVASSGAGAPAGFAGDGGIFAGEGRTLDATAALRVGQRVYTEPPAFPGAGAGAGAGAGGVDCPMDAGGGSGGPSGFHIKYLCMDGHVGVCALPDSSSWWDVSRAIVAAESRRLGLSMPGV